MTNILVADDDPDFCDLLTLQLGRVGHSVVVAGDGAEALEAAERGSFDLFVLDCTMPRLTGFEVLEALRSQPTYERAPVILMSAQAAEALAATGRSTSRADAYLEKPFSLAALSAQVDALLTARGVAHG